MTLHTGTAMQRLSRGSVFVEYCIVFAVVVATAVLMAPYITGAVGGRIHAAMVDLAPQYHPGRTNTTDTNRFAMTLNRTEEVFETSNVTPVGVPTIEQAAAGEPFTGGTTIGVVTDLSRQNVVVTTSNQTITQESHETSSDVIGRPTLP